MAVVSLKQQLNGFLASLYAEGVLDRQFEQLQTLQDANNPGFVADVTSLFCEDSERILTELSKYMDQPGCDYLNVDAYVHQLKGSSSSVGARLIKLACVDFRRAWESNDSDGCLRALNLIKHEYNHVRSKFETVIQLEERILACETKQQG